MNIRLYCCQAQGLFDCFAGDCASSLFILGITAGLTRFLVLRFSVSTVHPQVDLRGIRGISGMGTPLKTL